MGVPVSPGPSPTVPVSSSTTSTERWRYSTRKFSMRGCLSTMCRVGRTGQKAEEEDEEEDEEVDEEGGGGGAGATADGWLRGPNMPAGGPSLEKLLENINTYIHNELMI